MEMSPVTPIKRTRAKKPADTAVKTATASAIQSKPKRKSKETPASQVPSADLPRMIATAAYYLAAKRNFLPGHEMEDWLTAERQILAIQGR